MELLHDHEYALRSLEHAGQVDNARVVQALKRNTAEIEGEGK